MTTTASALARPAHVGSAPANKPPRTRVGDRARLAENETTLHIDILRYLRTVLPDAIVWHPANGGYRNKADAARFQRMGVLPGIPDIIVWLSGGMTLAFEVKTSNGRLSPEQAGMHGWMRAAGHKVAVVRSIDEAREALAIWKVWTREVGR